MWRVNGDNGCRGQLTMLHVAWLPGTGLEAVRLIPMDRLTASVRMKRRIGFKDVVARLLEGQ